MNSYIVCLSAIDTSKLNSLLNKIAEDKGPIEIWTLVADNEIINWAKGKGIVCKTLTHNSVVSFNTPVDDMILEIPEEFASTGNIYFTATVQISSDNYLMGCIYHLSKLLQLQQIEEHTFPDKLFELYLYFRENSFFLFTQTSEEPLKGNAWEIDSQLITALKLKKNRLYGKCFQTLLYARQTDAQKYNLAKSSISLYSSSFGITLTLTSAKRKIATYSAATSILTTLVYNKGIKPVFNKFSAK